MTKTHDAIAGIASERDDLLNRLKDASILLYDWDGYYDPETGKGDARMLAEIIEEAYTILQGESWRPPVSKAKTDNGTP